MSIKTIVGGLVSLAALCGVVAVFITSAPVSANDAEFCRTNSTASRAPAVCEEAYNQAGSRSQQVCSTNYSGEAEKNACLEGHAHRLSIDREARISNGERCNVTGLGWVVCALSYIVGAMADGLFAVLEQLMAVSPLDQTKDGGRELYKVWGMFRSIANVIFIILFMMVIISHTSNIGLDNYSLKRTMPRMIVGALLINLSFIICGLMVDITNIIGTSLKDVLSTIARPVQPQFSDWDSLIGVALIGAGGISVYLGVFAIAPIIFSGIVALLMTVVILVVRHALIITLVIIAPLAFALNILPSTQKWFNKWWSSFIVLIMLYPMIAFVFGATKVAAGVISMSAPDGAIGTLIFGTFALGVQSIPFFITPLLVKLGGGLINRFTGIVNNPSKGLIDRGRKRVDQWATNKTNTRETNSLMGGKGLHAAVVKRRNRTDKVAKFHKDQLSSPTKGTFGEFATSEDNRKKLAQHTAKNAASPWDVNGEEQRNATAERLERGLEQAHLKISVAEIDAAEAGLVNSGYAISDLDDLLKTNTHKDGSAVISDEKAAALKHLASQSGGDVEKIHELMDMVAGMSGGADAKSILALADGIDASGVASSAAHLGPAATNQMRAAAQRGGGIQNSQQAVAEFANKGGLNGEEQLSMQSGGTISKLAEAHGAGLLTDEAHSKILKDRSAIDASPKFKANQSPQARREMRNF